MHTIERDGWSLSFSEDLSGEVELRVGGGPESIVADLAKHELTVRIPGELIAALVERKLIIWFKSGRGHGVDEERERCERCAAARVRCTADLMVCSRCQSKVTWCYAAKSGNVCGSCWDTFSDGSRTDERLENDVAHARRRKDLAPDGG